MESRKVIGELKLDNEAYEVFYNVYEWQFDENVEYGSEIAYYRLKEGFKVYRVGATYAKSLKPSRYYVCAKSIRDARKIFTSRYSWLNVIDHIVELDDNEAEEVLTQPFKHYII